MLPFRVYYPFVGDTVGGSHLSAAELIGGLDNARFEPVVALHLDGALRTYFEDRGIVTEQAPALAFNSVKGSLAREAAAVLMVTLRLSRFLRRASIDIVHTNDYRMHIFWATAAKLAGAKFVWHQRSAGAARQFRIYARFADAILTVSDYCRNQLRPVMGDRPRVILNPFRAPLSMMDPGLYRQKILALKAASPAASIVGYVSNFRRQKRPLIFIEMASRLRDRFGGRLLFAMFGEARCEEAKRRVESKIAECGLTSHCALMGPQFPIEPWLMGCDVLVAPGLNEAYGRTLVEAMLCGTPVVAADSGGHREIIRRGETGILVRADDVMAFAEATASLLEQPAATKGLATRAKSAALKTYSVSAHVKQVEEVYDSILRPNREAAMTPVVRTN